MSEEEKNPCSALFDSFAKWLLAEPQCNYDIRIMREKAPGYVAGFDKFVKLAEEAALVKKDRVTCAEYIKKAMAYWKASIKAYKEGNCRAQTD